MEVKSFETQWGDKTLTIETGKLAHQAGGACTVRLGETVVFATCTKSPGPRDAISYFPLSVDYEERLYAAGKIKGSRFMKREGRPGDEAIMTGRMIDRGLRPLFPKGIAHDVQVIAQVVSMDKENDADIPAMIGTVCAIMISEVPWHGPTVGARVGRLDGKFVLNPTYEQRKESDMDVVVAGTPEKIIMLEANMMETPEAEANDAIVFAQDNMQPVMDLLNEVQAAVGKEKVSVESLSGNKDDDETKAEKEELRAQAKTYVDANMEKFFFGAPKETKAERREAKSAMKRELDEQLKEAQVGKDKRKVALDAVETFIDASISLAILKDERRVDGRKLDEVRAITSEVGLLPRTHGSGLFSRGETQILSTVTLGPPGASQIIDGLEEEYKKTYMHHYYFPPYSVGETGRLGGTGRREIGHGGLAERAIVPVLPSKEDFPYVIRVVSEVLTSNGSSSQGSACGSSLALMDAGVPLKRPVAGVAMGIATNADATEYKILADLQDLEDGEGGMDFKVAGSEVGITTIQLDTKTHGLNRQIVKETIDAARPARMVILETMNKAIATHRPEMSPYAPRLTSFSIDPEKIRDVIGPGGKIINEIIDTCGVTIDIEQDGTVTVASESGPSLEEAVAWINRLTKEVEVGELYKTGKVVRLMDFGAFVELTPNKDGMVHISELAPWRVERVTDIVKMGDVIPVKVIGIDDAGRVNLSHKAAMTELGQEQKRPEGSGGGGSAPRNDRPKR